MPHLTGVVTKCMKNIPLMKDTPMASDLSEYEAPAGTFWVCPFCRRRSTNRAKGTIHKGWDESCFLKAMLCQEADLVLDPNTGLVLEVRAAEYM